VVVVNGSFGDVPDPSAEEAVAWQEMFDKFTEIDNALVKAGVRAADARHRSAGRRSRRPVTERLRQGLYGSALRPATL
jgi:hypothetical protein